MQTTQAHALALLPERQAHYERCCATHAHAVAAGAPKSVLAAQQSVAFALATLNTTRAAAGLSAVTGPRMRSLDELLALATDNTTRATEPTAAMWVVTSIYEATNAQAA